MIIPSHTIPYYNALQHTILSYKDPHVFFGPTTAILYHIILTIPYHTIPHYAML